MTDRISHASQEAAVGDGHRRTTGYRRDFQTIYFATLAVCLLLMPFRRLATITQRHRGRRPSMLAQARTDAGIAASYALMGF